MGNWTAREEKTKKIATTTITTTTTTNSDAVTVELYQVCPCSLNIEVCELFFVNRGWAMRRLLAVRRQFRWVLLHRRRFGHFCLHTPLAGGQEKSFAEQMKFLGLRPGGWAWYFWHQFQFSMCSFVYSLLAAISHFLGHFGSSFKLSICYTKGAHLFTHRWLQLLTNPLSLDQ